MHIRVLDLDGSITQQTTLMDHYRPAEHDLSSWGPRIRLGCSFSRFQRFERSLERTLEARQPSGPALTFCGSGDFHHVSLALLRRLPGPVNVLVLDNHPDWMRGIPFLHCGTWLYHAARLPQVRHVFHVGGNVDFDNSFRRLAPWPLLRSGKVNVLPGVRHFRGGWWPYIAHEPVRQKPHLLVTAKRLEGLLFSFRDSLEDCPLYISLDKDVLIPQDAAVNWDSGHLTLAEVENILRAFVDAAGGNLVGMDIVGDWSPVQTRGLFRRFLHWTEHPKLDIEPAEASQRNEDTNLMLLDTLSSIEADLRGIRPVRIAA